MGIFKKQGKLFRLSHRTFANLIIFISSSIMKNDSVFYDLVNKGVQLGGVDQKVRQYENQCNLKRYKITEISVDNAISVYCHIENKFYKNHDVGSLNTWVENQLRLFLWTVVCYMEVNKKKIHQFNQEDWGFFSQVFYTKEYSLFEYQACSLLDEEGKFGKWSIEEDAMLSSIIHSSENSKWNEIAKILFVTSCKTFLRSSKQCRQRWFNHLDPSKSKSSWTFEQLQLLFDHVLEKGKKWASLVKKLRDRRSEHSIKNKYNSIIKKQSKLTRNLSETEICHIILKNIARIKETHKREQADEFVFGIQFKFQNEYEEKQRKLNRKSRIDFKTQKSKFQTFRQKIQNFQRPKTQKTLKNEKGRDFAPFPAQKQSHELYLEMEKVQNISEQSIFCEEQSQQIQSVGRMNHRVEPIFREYGPNFLQDNGLDF